MAVLRLFGFCVVMFIVLSQLMNYYQSARFHAEHTLRPADRVLTEEVSHDNSNSNNGDLYIDTHFKANVFG